MRKAVRPVQFVFLFLSAAYSALPADVSVRFQPELTIPIESSGESLYTAGGGGTLVADVDVFSGLAPFLSADVSMVPLRGTGELLTLASGGFGLGYSFYPLSRLKVRSALGGGFFNGSAFDASRYGLYWTARAEAGYRFTPTFTVLGGLGYTSFLNSPSPSDPFFTGLSIGVTVDIGLGGVSSRSSGLKVDSEQTQEIFPIRYYSYAAESIGKITLTNNESSEIRDVTVRFKSEGLTSAAALCGSFPLIKRGESVSAPFYAALGERALDFTENSRAQGEIEVSYRLLDARVERTFSAPVSFNHRNAVTWKDPRAVAAFASPNDGAVLDLSKFAAGLVRERIRPDVDHALQYGMGLFEALRLLGLSYSEDPSSPYRDRRNDPESKDYIQYPYQTFNYRGGDSDDLSLLYIAALSSVGLQTALVPLPSKAYAAFALDSPEADARRFFADATLFAWKDGKAWVVVDTTRLREGFLSAWRAGADAWNAAVASGADSAFFSMTDAWRVFKPVGVSSGETLAAKPREDRLELAFENAVGLFVASEVGPRVERIRAEMGPSGGTSKQLNSLGILYARYGLYKEARAAFADSVAKGSRSALVNLANVALLLKDYPEAARLFEEVLKDDPSNKVALIGLARARYELDAFAEADDLYAKVNRIDPALAARYSYLSSRSASGSARASSAADRGGQNLWSDAE